MPDGIKKIGKYAFCACTSLTSITIPTNVTSIGVSAFIRSGLSSIVFVDSSSEWFKTSNSDYTEGEVIGTMSDATINEKRMERELFNYYVDNEKYVAE